jgi:hypothetical protein
LREAGVKSVAAIMVFMALGIVSQNGNEKA